MEVIELELRSVVDEASGQRCTAWNNASANMSGKAICADVLVDGTPLNPPIISAIDTCR
ncbi:hypothetical protein [Parafrankia sp. BMG5.11]|uniref:hypothetical protein n=1 Tax=Parafrankia sp. BMG5.11 TaxID=222540 RepID=UPI00140435FF|nr:hypothetical protein [Parafrankia sp. BMG5.11]